MDDKDGIRLDGKVALITGAAGEIGTATMQLMTRRGARIVAVDRNADALAKAVSTPPRLGQSRLAGRRRHARRRRRGLRPQGRRSGRHHRHLLQQCRYRRRDRAIVHYPLESFRRVLDVNVTGVFLGMKHVLPIMLEKNEGSIINTASIAGQMGSPHAAVYSASKHAVIGLTKNAANEVTGTKVRINCVCPGMIDSRMLSAIFQGRNPGLQKSVVEAKAIERIPAKRLGLTSEAASVVAFLASDEASYVHGSVYTVDGGRLSN